MKLTVGFGEVGFGEVGFVEVGFGKVGFSDVGENWLGWRVKSNDLTYSRSHLFKISESTENCQRCIEIFDKIVAIFFIFSAFFLIGKKTLMLSPCPSVCPSVCSSVCKPIIYDID